MSTEKYQQSSENSAYLEVLFSIYGCRPVQFTVAVVLTVMYRSLKKSVLFSSQSVCACASAASGSRAFETAAFFIWWNVRTRSV